MKNIPMKGHIPSGCYINIHDGTIICRNLVNHLATKKHMKWSNVTMKNWRRWEWPYGLRPVVQVLPGDTQTIHDLLCIMIESRFNTQLPTVVGGDLYLNSLIDLTNVVLPTTIGGRIIVNKLAIITVGTFLKYRNQIKYY